MVRYREERHWNYRQAKPITTAALERDNEREKRRSINLWIKPWRPYQGPWRRDVEKHSSRWLVFILVQRDMFWEPQYLLQSGVPWTEAKLFIWDRIIFFQESIQSGKNKFFSKLAKYRLIGLYETRSLELCLGFQRHGKFSSRNMTLKMIVTAATPRYGQFRN